MDDITKLSPVRNHQGQGSSAEVLYKLLFMNGTCCFTFLGVTDASSHFWALKIVI